MKRFKLYLIGLLLRKLTKIRIMILQEYSVGGQQVLNALTNAVCYLTKMQSRVSSYDETKIRNGNKEANRYILKDYGVVPTPRKSLRINRYIDTMTTIMY
jgi:hypothetical protein